ncbi:MAG: hypothetical protein JKY94_16725 [Rhodobacteraceae bacterium]|nr:hypothetical protein [Paracoccaceae bacterium]
MFRVEKDGKILAEYTQRRTAVALAKSLDGKVWFCRGKQKQGALLVSMQVLTADYSR